SDLLSMSHPTPIRVSLLTNQVLKNSLVAVTCSMCHQMNPNHGVFKARLYPTPRLKTSSIICANRMNNPNMKRKSLKNMRMLPLEVLLRQVEKNLMPCLMKPLRLCTKTAKDQPPIYNVGYQSATTGRRAFLTNWDSLAWWVNKKPHNHEK